MKVRDLLEEINGCKQEYGDDFLEFDIYTEQLSEDDKSLKRSKEIGGNWKTFIDDDEWEYFECAGFWLVNPQKKIFTVNVNY